MNPRYLLPLLLAGCSDVGFTALKEPNAGDGPAIEVEPGLLTFGAVSRDEEAAVQSFTIRSVGTMDLEVVDMFVDGEAAASFTLLTDSLNFLLPPGAEQAIDVAFTPLGANAQDANVQILNNDPDRDIETVVLVGEGAVPELQIAPDPIDFGNSYVGCEELLPVELTNVGTDLLQISAIDFAADPEMWLVPDYALPIELEPGAMTTLWVGFNPAANIEYGGSLTVTSNEPLGSRVAQQLGVGRYAGEYEEVWEVPSDPPTDILFAVDQSCSMDDDTARLASNFSNFISLLSGYSTDWQIIVANNDDGCNMGGILTPSTPGYADTFRSQVGNGGEDYTEALLSVAANAVEAGAAGRCNYGFVREDAALHLILVSDEPEQSNWITGQTWSTLVSRIQTAKGDAGLVKISAIAGDYPSGCSSADAGTGYYEAMAATGGEFLSICSDWASATNLERLASASITQTAFTLERTPLESTIEVTLNGAPVSGWTYDASTNTVTFPAEIRPEEGDLIVITYGGVATCD